MHSSRVDPHAQTQHAGANGREPGCYAGERALALLVESDDETPSVFEQLRSLNALVRTRGNLIVAGVWVLAATSIASLVLR